MKQSLLNKKIITFINKEMKYVSELEDYKSWIDEKISIMKALIRTRKVENVSTVGIEKILTDVYIFMLHAFIGISVTALAFLWRQRPSRIVRIITRIRRYLNKKIGVYWEGYNLLLWIIKKEGENGLLCEIYQKKNSGGSDAINQTDESGGIGNSEHQ